MLSELSTFGILGERYLDTQHDAKYVEELEAELARRGIVGLKRAMYEYIAASAFWWNILWWDWHSLNERDIKIGWTKNIAIYCFLALVLVSVFNAWAALAGVLLLHLATLRIGLGLRKGSVRINQLEKPNSPNEPNVRHRNGQ